MDNFITALGLTLGALGLIATLVGTWISYISFVNPLKRFRKYLKNPKVWEKFEGREDYLTIYRHRKYPNFQIVIDWNSYVVKNFHEEWINDGLFRDKENNTSYYVKFEANGMLLHKELFVSLDGHRYFVPVPKINIVAEDRTFSYNANQIQLANIVGEYSFGDNNICDFIEKLKIRIEKN